MMEGEFKKRNGYYYCGEIGYPSATTVTRSVGDSSGLIRWAVAQGAEALIRYFDTGSKLESTTHAKEIAIAGYETELNRTGSFGSNVHNCIEGFLLHGEEYYPALNEKEQLALKAFLEVLKNEGIKKLLVEKELINKKDLFAGRIDFYAEITSVEILNSYLRRSSPEITNGKYIIDFKTGSFDKLKHGLQLSAYAEALRANGYECDGGLILTVERENPEKVLIMAYSREDLDMYYKKFLAVHCAWKEIIAPQWWHKQFEKGDKK